MDTPSLVNLPVEIALFIAEQFEECQDVLSFMRVYLVSSPPSPDTTRRFRNVLLQIILRDLQARKSGHPPGRLRPWCWAIQTGDVQLARFALAEGRAIYREIERLERERVYALLIEEYENTCLVFEQFGEELPPRPLPPDDSTVFEQYSDFCRQCSVVDESLLVEIPAAAMGESATEPGKICDPTPAMLAVLSGNPEMMKLVLEELPHFAFMSWYSIRHCRKVELPLEVESTDLYLSAHSLAVFLGRLTMLQMLLGASTKITWPLDVGGTDSDCSNYPVIFGWGMDRNVISTQQQARRLALLQYFLSRGGTANDKVLRPPWMTGERRCSTNRLPKKFTPLWFAIWALDPDLVPAALLLIRRDARWSPWTAWEMAPWGRGRIRPPGQQPNRLVSPLEWVARGGQCSPCYWHQEEPDAARLQVEQTLFKAMMEEGVEPPTTPYELQSALEVVIFAHFTRGFHDHPLLSWLYEERVRYLVGKGARLEDLDAEFTKAAAGLAQTWGQDQAGRLRDLPVEEEVEGTLREKTRGKKKRAKC